MTPENNIVNLSEYRNQHRNPEQLLEHLGRLVARLSGTRLSLALIDFCLGPSLHTREEIESLAGNAKLTAEEQKVFILEIVDGKKMSEIVLEASYSQGRVQNFKRTAIDALYRYALELAAQNKGYIP